MTTTTLSIDTRMQQHGRRRRRRATGLLILLVAAAVAIAYVSLAAGAADIPITTLLALVTAPDSVGDIDRTVVLDLRLPRLISALSIGAILSVSGVALQSVFRNPLADPALVGSTAGASAGAVLYIVIGTAVLPSVPIATGLPLAAALASIAAVVLVRAIATRRGVTATHAMLLAGIAISSLSWAVVGTCTTLANDAQLRTITFWTLGSMAGISMPSATLLLCVAVAASLIVLRLSPALAVIAAGSRPAIQAGVPVQSVVAGTVIAAGAATGVAVAFAGTIGFVGLVVPHIVRGIAGSNVSWQTPLAALFGAVLLAGADVVSRTVFIPIELPIGIVTALFGIPFFIAIVVRERSKESS
jgi:iron complex transport system permease protein